MTLEGADFSWARPGADALIAAGKRFAIRYVPYPGDGGKGLTVAEVVDYHGHGLGIVVVFESYAGRFLEGFAAGAADARTAVAGLTALGFPVGSRPIYFACDKDTNSSQWPAIDAYFKGVNSVIGKEWTGAYAEWELIEHLAAVGLATWHWQTYAWSGGRLSSKSELYQYLNGQTLNGGSIDLDRALTTDYGQWGGDEVNQYPVPKVPSTVVVNRGATLYKTSDCITAAGNINIDPGRPLPYFGTVVPGVYAVEYVGTDGVHTGTAWFVKSVQCGAISPVVLGDPTAVPRTTYDAAVAARDAAIAAQKQAEADEAAAVAAEAAAEAAAAVAQAAATQAQNEAKAAEDAQAAVEAELADWHAFKDAAARVGI